MIANILSDQNARAFEFGRGGNLNLPVQTAVKTGTSNDHRDAWVFGFNHRYLVGVWMGNLSSEPMQLVTGSSGPAQVMRSMFAALNRRGVTRPLYLSPRLVKHRVCIATGRVSDGLCDDRDEYFVPNSLPQPSALKPRHNGSKSRQNNDVDEIDYHLINPVEQMQVAYDPRIPDHLQTLEFQLSSVKHATRIEWYVNDKLIATNQRAKQGWPIARGEYTVMAKIFVQKSAKPHTVRARFTVK